MSEENFINEDDLYIFTSLYDNKYHTLFACYLSEDLIKLFTGMMSPLQNFLFTIDVGIGEHKFQCIIDQPMYLLNHTYDAIFEHAGDGQVLNLFPSGEIPDEYLGEVMMDFPTYFDKEVEKYFEYRLFKDFATKIDGHWHVLNI